MRIITPQFIVRFKTRNTAIIFKPVCSFSNFIIFIYLPLITFLITLITLFSGDILQKIFVLGRLLNERDFLNSLSSTFFLTQSHVLLISNYIYIYIELYTDSRILLGFKNFNIHKIKSVMPFWNFNHSPRNKSQERCTCTK